MFFYYHEVVKKNILKSSPWLINRLINLQTRNSNFVENSVESFLQFQWLKAVIFRNEV